MISQAKKRTFLKDDFDIKNKAEVESVFARLSAMPSSSEEELLGLLGNMSETQRVIEEQSAWIQIRLTRDTSNKNYEQDYTYLVTELTPFLTQAFFDLQKKIMDSPAFAKLSAGDLFPYFRKMKNEVRMYRDENIPLESEEALLAQKYGQISAAMTIEHEGEEITLQQANKLLENRDRVLREQVYRKVQTRRYSDADDLMKLFTKLRKIRQRIAKNADYQNYRDYKFDALGRFDYGPDDCYEFHQNVKKYFLPLYEKILENRRQELGVDKLRPWDLSVPLPNEKELKPFANGQDLINKSIALFGKMDSYFEECIVQMDDMDRFDLDSRKNKAPGGYNCPLPETGAPFIFMNSVGTIDDVITMMHESGHAFHSFLSHELEYAGELEYPMEMAELASMSMELMSMDYWDTFLSGADEFDQARKTELERVISVLPWVATIDKFQHYIYTHPDASEEELNKNWLDIHREFSPQTVDWGGLESYREILWQKQLHLYEVPFYYIEYGISQIGAIGVWLQYRRDPQSTLEKYKKALAMGHTKTLPELYSAAGISFDFGAEKMKELSLFLSSFI